MPSYANFCVATWLLLFAVDSHLCKSGLGIPLPHTECLTYSKALLRNVSIAVEQLGFYCSKLSVETNNRKLSVCEPKNSSCSNHRTSGFDEDACFGVIREDLQYYKNMLPKIQNAHLRATLLGAIEDLVKNCAFPQVQENPASPKAPQAPSFEDRVHLCKELRGFHIRAITVNRVMSYIASGDHLK